MTARILLGALLGLLVGTAVGQNYVPVNPAQNTCVIGASTLTPSGGTGWTCVVAGTSTFSGAYADLTGKPSLGTAAATAASDYATAAQGATANSALQPSGNGGSLTGLTKTQVGLGNVDNTSDAAKPVSTTQQTALNLKADLASPTFTGTVGGASIAVTGPITSSGTSGIGYAAGAGCAVTQLTNKATATPACNKLSGEITMNGAALAAGAIVSFTLTNSVLGAKDVIVMNHVTTGTRGAYLLQAQASAGSGIIYVRNTSAASLAEAIVIRFIVIKGVTS